MDIEFEDGLHPWKYTDVNGKLIREKNLDVYITISKYIQDYYKETLHNVIFAYGNNHLIENVLRNSVGNKIVAYLDLPMDNLDIVEKWCELLYHIMKSRRKNIVLVPIPCIEYCVCKSEGVDFCDMGLYRQGEFYENNVSKKRVTYEKYCKAVFSTLDPKIPKEVRLTDWVYNSGMAEKIVKSLPVYACNRTEGNFLSLREANIQISELLDRYVRQLKEYVENGYVSSVRGYVMLCKFEQVVREYKRVVQGEL